jgi:tetratricopeptide (TPR) repeat protein
MPRTTSSNGNKPDRDELRRLMQAQGCTLEQIANEMARSYGFRPRTAWRHAHGWGQVEAAARYNELVGDGNASMSNRRISDFEAWPIGGTKPTGNTLSLLAQLYHTSVANLVDAHDLKAYSLAERKAINGLTLIGSTAADHSLNVDRIIEPQQTSSSTPNVTPSQLSEQPSVKTIAAPSQSPVWSIEDLVNSVAEESRSHAETTQGYLMATSTIDEITSDILALSHERDETPVLTMFSDTVQIRNRIYRLMERRQRPQQSTQLYFLASVVSAFLANFSDNLGMSDAAKEQAQASWTYAEMIGHNSLRVWARKKQAALAERDGRPSRAIGLILSAQDWATEPLARASLNNSLARTYAKNGQLEKAREALTVAQNAFEHTDGSSELFDHIGGIFNQSRALMLLYSSELYREFGDTDTAEREASEMLSLYDTMPEEEKAYDRIAGGRINLAHTRLISHGIEAAEESLQEVLTLPPNMRVGWVVDDLNDLYRALQRHGGAASHSGIELAGRIEEFSEVTARDGVPKLIQ